MFGKPTNDIVIDEVDTGATKPSREMTSRGRVALNGQRRISLSGKLVSELFDPCRQRSWLCGAVIADLWIM
ncbi:hypothetical protein [Sinorhizobium meliloti]|uniref:hypothetical protein n=1 Tax=Rhizobium meliloti TaxID=382 RepID=UPI0030CF9CB8